MADPAQILNDPDFIKANPATKQAIFARHVENDPDYKSADDATKAAIRARFGFEPPAEETSLPEDFFRAADQTGMPGPRKSFGDVVQGITEVPGVLLTGGVATLAGNIAGPLVSMREGTFGTPQGVKRAQEVSQAAQKEFTYQPRTQTGRDILSGLSGFIDTTKLAGLNPYMATELGVLGAPALRQGKLTGEAKLAERNALIQEQNVARSFQNAAQIDAAKLAVKHGIIIDPAVSNPTVTNRLTAGAAKSTNFAENAAKLNDARFTQLAIEDMGLPPNTVLDAKAIKKALAMHDAPYEVIAKIKRLTPTKEVLEKIETLRIKRPSIGGEKNAAAVNELVDETLSKIKEGRSGKEINLDIRNLRREANDIYSAQQKSGQPDATKIARADANKKIADALEALIDANAPNAEVLANLRKARAAKAKVYDYERALNNQTNRIDPQILAKMAKDEKPLSGTAADIAKIASVFPDIAKTGQTGIPTWAKGLTRSGAAGTAGLTAAAVLGAPLIPGAVIGAGLGYVGGGLAARRMASPKYQAKHAVPQDFRPLESVNKLAPEPRNNLRK